MSITTKLTASLTATCLLLTMFVSNSAYADSLPGIEPSGTPAFANSVKVTLRNDSIIVRSNSRDFLLGTSSGLINGTSGSYLLNGDWDSSGNFLGGSLSLKGEIPALNIPKNTLLVTADLTAGNSNVAWSEFLIGFNTSNIVCDPLLVAAIGSCTTNESVYLEIDDSFDGNFNRNGRDQLRTTGTAITTIPLPAAVWLFGSGLAGLIGVTGARRRKKHAAVGVI